MGNLICVDGTDYKKLISQFENVPTVFFDDLEYTVQKKLCIRHDVDINLKRALNFAKVERTQNIVSTYFVLPSAKYFDYSNHLIHILRTIQDLGHRVGLHNDVISGNIKTMIIDPLKFLRKNKIKVSGSACHGSNKNYNQKFLNYEVWKEFDSDKNEGYLVHKLIKSISMKELDLVYETYFSKFDYYLSDSGNKWRGYEVKKASIKLFERSLLNSKLNIKKTVVQKFNMDTTSCVFQLLIHPLRWRIV